MCNVCVSLRRFIPTSTVPAWGPLRTAHPCSSLSAWVSAVVSLNGAPLPRGRHSLYQRVWAGLMYQSRAIFMVYDYGSFLAHIATIILSNRLPPKPCVYSFYHPSREGELLRRDFSQAAPHRGLRSQASSSHFPFGCFTGWDVLTNQVTLGNHHTPGYTAYCWHSRRSVNTCGAGNESWVITVNHPKRLAFSLPPRQWFSNLLASNQVFGEARGCAGLIPPAPS